VLERAKLSIADIELFEFNEAVRAQSVAVARELKLDPEGSTSMTSLLRSGIRSARATRGS
jgi:acetyl-CoA acetyltransferase